MYLSGQSRNKTILTWTGLNGNLSFKETFDHMYRSSVNNIVISATNGSITDRILVPHGTCKVFEGKPPHYVSIIFTTIKEYSNYFIFVSDPSAAANFQLASSLMLGDHIHHEPHRNSSFRKYTNYNIKLTEKRVETDDESCAAYPNDNHQSYSACIEENLRKKIMQILGKGISLKILLLLLF